MRDGQRKALKCWDTRYFVPDEGANRMSPECNINIPIH
jgi:Glu-tRNA(Gln) amidotransferase subunit E-like FAD-binding protein